MNAIPREDEDIVAIQENIYDILKSYAYLHSQISEQELKHGLTESQLIRLIETVPMRVLGKGKIKRILESKTSRRYISEKILKAMYKRLN